MVTVAEEMTRQGFHLRCLIGARPPRRCTPRCASRRANKGPTVHVLDASRAVGVCSALMSESGSQAEISRPRSRPSTRPSGSSARAAPRKRSFRSRSRAPTASRSTGRPIRRPSPPSAAPAFLPSTPCTSWSSASTGLPFFRSWELAGNYPAILEDPVVGDSARKLYADARKMLERIVREKWLTAKGVVRLLAVPSRRRRCRDLHR